jgi:hypothetical protein
MLELRTFGHEAHGKEQPCAGGGAAMHGLRRRHQVMKPDQDKVLCFKVASFSLPISQWALGLDSFSPSEEVTASEGAVGGDRARRMDADTTAP